MSVIHLHALLVLVGSWLFVCLRVGIVAFGPSKASTLSLYLSQSVRFDVFVYHVLCLRQISGLVGLYVFAIFRTLALVSAFWSLRVALGIVSRHMFPGLRVQISA